MLLCELSMQNRIAVVRLLKPSLFKRGALTLESMLNRIVQCEPKAVVFDASKAGKISFSTMSGLLEAVLRLRRQELHANFVVAVCALDARNQKWLEKFELDRIVPVFETLTAVFQDKRFKRVQLTGLRSVILCADQDERLSPLNDRAPAAMLDFLGKPILGRLIDHGRSFGIRDFVVNPGGAGQNIAKYVQSLDGISSFCVNEKSWQKAPSNGWATLLRLHDAHSVFESDTLVVQGDCLTNINLNDVLEAHRKNGADVTVATPMEQTGTGERDVACLKSFQASALIISPTAMDVASRHSLAQRKTEILPALYAAGLNVQVHRSDHEFGSVCCGRDYFDHLRASLDHGAFDIEPIGERIQERVWASGEVSLGRKVTFDGPCFLGAGARIDAGVLFKGFNCLGRESVVNRNVVMSNSVLFPETMVLENSFVDHMIAAPQWAINHRFADGSPQNQEPLERTRAARVPDTPVDADAPANAKFA